MQVKAIGNKISIKTNDDNCILISVDQAMELIFGNGLRLAIMDARDEDIKERARKINDMEVELKKLKNVQIDIANVKPK